MANDTITMGKILVRGILYNVLAKRIVNTEQKATITTS